jgi:capsular exopolysaccharide synthesis family protein
MSNFPATSQSDQFLPPPQTDDHGQAHDLVRYYRAIRRYGLGIALLVVAVGILAAIYAFSLPAVYKGTATVMLEQVRKKAMLPNEELAEAWSSTSRDYYLTQIEVMKSSEYAERLVRVLGLTKHPDYAPAPEQAPAKKGWFSSLIERFKPSANNSQPQGSAVTSTTSTENDLVEGIASQIMGGLTFTPIRNTQLVKVSFDSHDPVLAERVPNTLSMIYIVEDLESRSEGVRQSMSFLAQQTENLKKQLADSERELQQFRESQRIVVSKGLTLSEVTRRLEGLTTSLEEARRKRTDAEVLYQQVSAAARAQSSAALDTLPVLQRDPVLQRLKEAETEASRRATEASNRYGPEHPRHIAAQSDLKSARDAVRRQVNSVVESVAKEFEMAKAQEAALQQAQSRATTEAGVFNRTEFPLTRLERNVESNRRLYEAFVQRANEVRVGDVQQPIARVVDPARVPKGPSGPNRNRIIMLAMLGALFAGVAVALFLTLLDKGIKTGLDLESRLGIKTIGVLPLMHSMSQMALDRIVVDDNSNTFSEGIRTIRSDVQLSMLDAPQSTILVTSSVPGEGKTTVATNLAFAHAQIKRTLLIEADMRRPKVSKALRLDRAHPGLSEFVSGDFKIEQCIQDVPDTGLHVLHSGKVPLNPLEMLSSQRFANAMRDLKAMFEVIIIDSPPVELVSDSMVLSRFSTGVLFVVRAEQTPYPLARSTLTRLRRVGATIIGGVLNYFDVEKAHRYYGDYSRHGLEYYYRNYGYQEMPEKRGPSIKLVRRGGDRRRSTPVSS